MPATPGTYGDPVPTKVPLGHKKGKAILVSGHDLLDLEEILKQSDGKGIYVYTHGEMLPCHGYPKLKDYPHFYGHYGTAWQNQAKEFAQFPGAILMTTNCLQRPQEVYADNLFTTGLVGWPGIKHIPDRNFKPVIDKALALPGLRRRQQRPLRQQRLCPHHGAGRGRHRSSRPSRTSRSATSSWWAAATAPSPPGTTTPSSWRRCPRIASS